MLRPGEKRRISRLAITRMKHLPPSVSVVTAVAFGLLICAVNLSSQAVKTNIPYSDAKPILDVLREDLLPAELKAKTQAELEAVWPDWVSRRDGSIRARVEQGVRAGRDSAG